MESVWLLELVRRDGVLSAVEVEPLPDTLCGRVGEKESMLPVWLRV